MQHNVTPQRSEGPAIAVAEASEYLHSSPGGRGSSGLPGPISWDIPDGDPVSLGDAEDTPVDVMGRRDSERPVAPADPIAAEVGEQAGDADPGVAARASTWEPMPWEVAATPAEDRDPRLSGDWSLGPVGRRRNVALLTVLSVLTLGLAAVAWFRRAGREMREFDTRMTLRPGRTAAAVAIPVVTALVLAAAAGARVIADHMGHPVDLPVGHEITRWLVVGPAVVPWLCLLLPVSAVAVAMTMERVRVVEDRAGIVPDLQCRPAASMAWLLVPVVGLVVIVAHTQARLNRVWVIARP